MRSGPRTLRKPTPAARHPSSTNRARALQRRAPAPSAEEIDSRRVGKCHTAFSSPPVPLIGCEGEGAYDGQSDNLRGRRLHASAESRQRQRVLHPPLPAALGRRAPGRHPAADPSPTRRARHRREGRRPPARRQHQDRIPARPLGRPPPLPRQSALAFPPLRGERMDPAKARGRRVEEFDSWQCFAGEESGSSTSTCPVDSGCGGSARCRRSAGRRRSRPSCWPASHRHRRRPRTTPGPLTRRRRRWPPRPR